MKKSFKNIHDRREGERRGNPYNSGNSGRRAYTDRRSGMPRRGHERIKIKETVTVETKGDAVKIGKYIDISSGGLSFYYIDIGRRPERSFKLDLVDIDNRIPLMEGLAFRTVTDLPLTPNKEFEFSKIPLRRRGGRFKYLTQKQVPQLEDFIRNNTMI